MKEVSGFWEDLRAGRRGVWVEPPTMTARQRQGSDWDVAWIAFRICWRAAYWIFALYGVVKFIKWAWES